MDFIRPKRASVSIDLAPLIDCVFLLLIFFMLSSSYMQPAIPLKLPRSVSRVMPDPSRITISVSESGQLYLLDKPVTLDQLKEELTVRFESNPDQVVLFRGDQNLRYELFMSIVTVARQAGFQQLSLQHDTPVGINNP